VQNEVWEFLAGGHQSGFVLGVRDGPNPDIRVLTGNGTHPTVLGSLIQLVTESDARLGERLGGGSESGEGWVQELWDKVEDPGGGDVIEHVAMRE
jgi:hypothetical protein